MDYSIDRKTHWDTVYTKKTDKQTGWFQTRPETSIRLIEKYTSSRKGPIIDVGGGNSYLAKFLYDLGYSDLTVVDISQKAIHRSMERFSEPPKSIKWIVGDVLTLTTDRHFSLWHDRAVFHFLNRENEAAAYYEQALKYLMTEGILILGTFAPSGPQTCSGLPVNRYSAHQLSDIFSPGFKLVESFENVHTTPSGSKQNFTWAVFEKTQAGE